MFRVVKGLLFSSARWLAIGSLGCSLLIQSAFAVGESVTVKPLVSPRGSFTISQRENGEWTAILHFAHSAHPDIAFTDSYPWPASFFISPDDQWILQIQKSGSGENISMLFRLEADGRLRRMEPKLGELAFAYLEQTQHISAKDLYHKGIEFRVWDLKAGLLRFEIRASKDGEGGIDRVLIYDLVRHRFHEP